MPEHAIEYSIALRGMWELAEDDEYRGKALLCYFLEAARTLFYAEPIVGPSALQPPAFYKYVAKTLRSLHSQHPDLDIGTASATDVCETLAIEQLDDRQKKKSLGSRWQQCFPQMFRLSSGCVDGEPFRRATVLQHSAWFAPPEVRNMHALRPWSMLFSNAV